MSDSARWCDFCQSHGDHHTDRHFDVECSLCGDTGKLPIAGFAVKGGGFRRTGEATCPCQSEQEK